MDRHERFTLVLPPPTSLHTSFHFARLSCIVAREQSTRYNQLCSCVTTQKAEGFASVSFCLRRDWRHKTCVLVAQLEERETRWDLLKVIARNLLGIGCRLITFKLHSTWELCYDLNSVFLVTQIKYLNWMCCCIWLLRMHLIPFLFILILSIPYTRLFGSSFFAIHCSVVDSLSTIRWKGDKLQLALCFSPIMISECLTWPWPTSDTPEICTLSNCALIGWLRLHMKNT